MKIFSLINFLPPRHQGTKKDRKTWCLGVLVVLLIFSSPVQAQNKGNIVIDLAEDHVGITTGFSGEKVTVFGTADQDGDIAIVLRGPEKRIVMRKKKPVFGMWLNRESVDFKNVPLFYAYAMSRSENGISDAATLRMYGIGLNALKFDAANYDEDINVTEFEESLIRTQQAKEFFPLGPAPIKFVGQRLFKTSFYLPSDVPIGDYQVESYLFKDGSIIDRRAISLEVAQAGMSANILNFAVDHGFAYALLGLSLALSAGFMAFWMSRSQRA